MSGRDRFISGGPDGDAPTSLTRDVDRLVHKLRTPLNSLSLNADLIASVSQPKAGKEALYNRSLKSLQTEVGRLDRIAGDFQRYVAAADPRPAPANVADLVKGAVTEVREKSGREIEMGELPDGTITVDGRLLTGAVVELLLNAVEASSEGPVRVESRLADGSFEVDVIDRAAGIEFDPPDRIFELFMGGRQGHLGFGLTYARRIARVQGGEVSIVRTGPEGTTMRLSVPAAS